MPAITLLKRAALYLGLAVAKVIDTWNLDRKVLTREVITPLGTFVNDLHAAEQRSVLETGQTQVQVRRTAIGTHVRLIGTATLIAADYHAAPIQSEPDSLGKQHLRT